MAYQKQGEYSKAVEDFSRVIEINPNKPRVVTAYNNRGALRANMGNYKGSLEDFNKSLELYPSYGGTYIERGLAKIEFGNIESGCSDLEKAYDEGIKSAKKVINKYCEGSNGEGN